MRLARIRKPAVGGHTLLEEWGIAAQLRREAWIYFRDAAGGAILETLHLKAAYCVFYGEYFEEGDVNAGSFICRFALSDPDGWHWYAGGPPNEAAIRPAPREHGTPPVPVAYVSAGSWKGGAGPDGMGDDIGKFSRRRYDAGASGGPIVKAAWQDAVITSEGIATV